MFDVVSLPVPSSVIVKKMSTLSERGDSNTDEKLILKRIETPSARRPSSATSNVHKTRTSPIPRKLQGVQSEVPRLLLQVSIFSENMELT
jgi:hypothetical protein